MWNPKRILLTATILLVVAAAAWWFGLPAYRHWREENSLRQARQFFAESDFRSAAIATRQALVLNHTNVEACRLMGNLTELVRSPAALEWRLKVSQLQPGELTNQLQLARTALQLGQQAIAAQALDAVAPADREHPVYHQLTAMLALQRNDPAQAGVHLSEAARLEPDNKQIQFNLAVLGLQNTNAPLSEAAVQSLRELTSVPELRADALRQLTVNAILKSNHVEAVTYAGELLSLTNATTGDRLLQLQAVWSQGDRAEFERRLQETQAACEVRTNGFADLAAWLLRHQQVAEAVRWLASLPPPLQGVLEVKLSRADCFVTQKDWSELEQFAREDSWGNSEFYRLVLLARAGREMGRELAAQADWRAAMRAAESQPRRLALLVRLTSDWSWRREREELLWLILKRHPGEHWATDALHRSLFASENTLGLQRLYEELVSREPDNLSARNNLAAVSLLLNLQTERAHDLARANHQNAPTNAIFTSTYAYSLHLQGRTAEGLKIMDALPEAALAQPSLALYYGVLQSTIAPEKARAALDRAKAAPLLLPEEKALLEATQRRLP